MAKKAVSRKKRSAFITPMPPRRGPGKVVPKSPNKAADKVGGDFRRAVGKYTRSVSDEFKRQAFFAAAQWGVREINSRVVAMQMQPKSSFEPRKRPRIPTQTKEDIIVNSGFNGTYNARVHKIKYLAGIPPGRALRQLVAQNGEKTKRVFDSRYDMPDGGGRASLTKSFGFNQKLVLFPTNGLFGSTPAELYDDVLVVAGTPQTQSSVVQTAYAAITKLNSEMALVNNNKVLPMFITLKIVRQINDKFNWNSIPAEVINADLNVQEAGRVGKVFQLQNRLSDTGFNWTSVDKNKNNIHSCTNALMNYEVVTSKRVKLAAGDSLEFNYEHCLQSGINLNELFGTHLDTEFSSGSMYSYGLIIEAHGPQVEAIALDATGGLTNERHRGLAPGEFSMEFKRSATGARNSSTLGVLPGAQQGGYEVGSFAVRVFSQSALANTLKIRNWNYNQIGGNNGFRVPVISDTAVVQAGSKS